MDLTYLVKGGCNGREWSNPLSNFGTFGIMEAYWNDQMTSGQEGGMIPLLASLFALVLPRKVGLRAVSLGREAPRERNLISDQAIMKIRVFSDPCGAVH